MRRAAATRWYLVAGALIGCLVAVLTVAQAWVLAGAISGVFAAAPGWEYTSPTPGTGWWPELGGAALALAAIFAGKAALGWLNQVLAHRTVAAVKSRLRRDLVAARLARPLDPSASTARLVTLATVGLDALDGYYGKYLPQLLLAVTVPVLVGGVILLADVPAALIIALTLPLIPVFMVLVGWTTQARTERRWATQQRLAHHFADLVTGLPTLQVFGRARAQATGLRRTEDAHRAETMGTLRISFLSALVLELLATLSVALVAVTVGFRVVAHDLDLATALFVLILAPEVYLPVRQVGVHYHDAADGMAAADEALTFIEAAPATPTGPAAALPAGELVRVEGLAHTYPGADAPAVAGVDLTVAPGEFVVLTGPSGGGKTTVLNALVGFLSPTAGTVAGPGRARIAYVGQNPGMVAGTIATNVRLGDPDASDAAVADALARAGAPGMDPARDVGDDGEGLSAGERRRVAVARALLRIDAGADLLLLDEPTAGLDADAEASLLAGLRATGVAAVVVSHRPAVLAGADRVVRIGAVARVGTP
ncbi:thiol reductant ABC exporter subunit CydD [Propioniciclava soli]|uniref:Thiol reductant ABC exporter subunit CydD n=1 Tax=Propioniciclava soli TaxID=2775081 RepID=A0ABZ3CEE3_9ACTN